MTHTAEIDARMRTLLSEADSGGMGWKARLDAAMELVARAWDEGYVAGNAFGYEWAQDTYDGPSEDPTPNPYERVIPPEGGADD